LHKLWLRSLAVAFAVASVSQAATVYDPVAQYSPTSNLATNLWSYWDSTNGSLGSYTSNIGLIPTSTVGTCGGGVPTSCWTNNSSQNQLLYNASGSSATFSTAIAANNTLTFFTHAGLTVVRFLVPTTSPYSLTGAFLGASTSPTSTTEEINITTAGGTILRNLVMNTGALAFQSSNPFNLLGVSLLQGEYVDFLVSSPSANNATSLQAQLTPTPEPASLLIGLGGIGFLLLRRRKHA
jgi:hypothetical protein